MQKQSASETSRPWTITTSRTVLTMVVALWLTVFGNFTFWRTVWDGVGGWGNGNPLFLASLPLIVWLWLFGLLSLLAWGRATKAILAALVLVSASASYFIGSYGIVIDSSMLTNVMQTDTHEAFELLSWRMAGWLAVFGVLPALLIARVRLAVGGWKRELGYKLGSIAVALAGIGAIAFSPMSPSRRSIVEMSLRCGTLVKCMGSAVSNAEQRIGSAAFLAPEMAISPERVRPP